MTLFREDPRFKKPHKLVEEDHLTEDDLDKLRIIKDREKAALLEIEQRKEALAREKKEIQMKAILL